MLLCMAGAGVDQPAPGRRLRVHHGGPRILMYIDV